MSVARARSGAAGAAFLMLFALPALVPAAAASSLQANEPAAPERHMVMLHFYRLQAFHDMAAQRGCLGVFPDRMRALNGRYERLRRRVDEFDDTPRGGIAKSGQGAPDGDCHGGLLLSYEDKLVTLERYLAGGAR